MLDNDQRQFARPGVYVNVFSDDGRSWNSRICVVKHHGAVIMVQGISKPFFYSYCADKVWRQKNAANKLNARILHA